MPVTAPVASPTGVTALLQEGTKAPSSAPVASTTEVASTPPGAHAVEVDAPAAVEEDVPAAEQNDEAVPGEIAVDAQATEDPTAAAVQGQVRLPHLHVLRAVGQGVGLPSVRPLQGSVAIEDWPCCLTPLAQICQDEATHSSGWRCWARPALNGHCQCSWGASILAELRQLR